MASVNSYGDNIAKCVRNRVTLRVNSATVNDAFLGCVNACSKIAVLVDGGSFCNCSILLYDCNVVVISNRGGIIAFRRVFGINAFRYLIRGFKCDFIVNLRICPTSNICIFFVMSRRMLYLEFCF